MIEKTNKHLGESMTLAMVLIFTAIAIITLMMMQS